MTLVAEQNGTRVGGGQGYALTSDSPIPGLLMLVRRVSGQDKPFPGEFDRFWGFTISHSLEDQVGKQIYIQIKMTITTTYAQN